MNIDGVVVRGYGVASGLSQFDDVGTIVRQKPYFKALGLDLSVCFNGTINVDIVPLTLAGINSDYCFLALKWHPELEPEDFHFVDCLLWFKQRAVKGYIYYPAPDTKPDHVQPDTVLEVLAPYIDGLKYGDKVILELNSQRLILV